MFFYRFRYEYDQSLLFLSGNGLILILFAYSFRDSTQFKIGAKYKSYVFLKTPCIESRLLFSNLSNLLKLFYKSKDKMKIFTLVLLRIL